MLVVVSGRQVDAAKTDCKSEEHTLEVLLEVGSEVEMMIKRK